MRASWEQIEAWFERRNLAAGPALAYAALVGIFLFTLAQFFIPGKGFSYLIAFGARQEGSRISKVRKLDYHVERASDGYDAQYYAQIAMDPSLQNKQLRRAVDSLPYRGRRILLPALSYVFGFGDPASILQAYALQNVISWLLTAILLLHWFPPRSWDNFLRWAGVLFSFGVCVSFRNSLVDGPSLLLLAFGVYLLDKGRPWWSTLVFGISGLGKETNLLGAASLLPKFSDGSKAWVLAIVRGVLVALPLMLWLLYIQVMVGPAGDLGARNFDWPFFAYARKWREIFGGLPDMAWPEFGPLWGLLMMITLTVQFIYMLARPQWDKAWWRIGASYALLMVALGDAVWEGYPGAASRVLLPMQLAFNVLVPVGRGWRFVLLLGNLTLLASPAALQAPLGEGYVLKGRDEFVYATQGRQVEIEYGEENWFSAERYGSDFWCWSSGSAVVTLTNPHAKPLVARLRFGLSVNERRNIRLVINGVETWDTTVAGTDMVNVLLNTVTLAPGVNKIEFVTDAPATKVGNDPRPLAFRLLNLRFDLQRFAEPAKP